MSEYNETLYKEINEGRLESDKISKEAQKAKSGFAEYLKANFNGEIREIIEKQEEIKKEEQSKSKFRKIMDKIFNVL